MHKAPAGILRQYSSCTADTAASPTPNPAKIACSAGTALGGASYFAKVPHFPASIVYYALENVPFHSITSSRSRPRGTGFRKPDYCFKTPRVFA